jgi:hypothetical protein
MGDKPLRLNRLRSKEWLVKENELTDEQAEKVFDDLPPESYDAQGRPRYEESVVDRKIERERFEAKVGKGAATAFADSVVRETLVELMKGVAEARASTAGSVTRKAGSNPRHREIVGTAYIAQQMGITQSHVKRLIERMPARCKAKRKGRMHQFYKAEVDRWIAHYTGS